MRSWCSRLTAVTIAAVHGDRGVEGLLRAEGGPGAAGGARVDHLVVAERVELDPADAPGGQAADLVDLEGCEVFDEVVRRGVDGGAALAVPDHPAHRGADHRDLERAGRAGGHEAGLDAGQVLLSRHRGDRDRAVAERFLRRELLAVPVPAQRPAGRFDAAERLQQACPPGLAARLAVGEHGQAGLLLDVEELGDRAVLDLVELRRRQLARLVSLAGPQEIRRPEEAAHVFGVVRGGHG